MSNNPITDLNFSELNLHPELLQGLSAAGFTHCTPIQALTLPIALSGKDIAGQAQTGTGKTLAFLIVVINRLLSQNQSSQDVESKRPRALILAPTRELAVQIYNDAKKFTANTSLRFAVIYGGVDYEKQRRQLEGGVDIVIATPGRLIDYVKQHRVINLGACEVCVLDEADRMFDLGFLKDIRFLLRQLPPREHRQTLLFSATLNHRVLELAYEHMNDPEKLIVETETVTATRVRQRMYYPADEEKIPLLLGLLSRSDAKRAMVFVNTKAYVEKVARALEQANYLVGVLSGDVPQKKREALLRRFQAGQLEVLVATDVAARGLHINGVDYVYNFDLPTDAEDYVHRIGRTARLGAEGDAISFACERYAMSLPDIEDYIQQKIPSESVTAELLTAIPREKPVVTGDSESIRTIFDDVRKQKQREPRAASGDKTQRKRRPRTKKKPSQDTAKPATEHMNHHVQPATADASTQPRRSKPRRRKPSVRSNEQTNSVVREKNTAIPATAHSAIAADKKPGLLTRIKNKLRAIANK